MGLGLGAIAGLGEHVGIEPRIRIAAGSALNDNDSRGDLYYLTATVALIVWPW